ncbi:hypothetical protein FJY68_08260 [candidate division WOR-3 bacterium]|uniref:histidine kinase n=1 Tax=candidate division WOR-3 bacterium TaxID=2052148 RepID=A0A938BTP1_UNCW3|nr:hypothetical protein [candidate division WOR-3 bacterium]
MRAVVAGSDNMLRLLDASLRVVRRARTATGVRHVLAGSFSCPRASEFMVVTDDGYLRVMDQGMNPLGEIRLGAGGLFFDVTPVRYHGRDRLLMHEADGDKSNWSLLDVVPLPVTGLSIPLVQAVSAVAGLTFAFAMILLGFRYRQTRDMRLVVLGLTGQAGVVEIGKRGQVRHTNQKARELLGGEALPAGPLVQAAQAALAEPPGATPKELPVALRGGMTVLARAARVRSGVMLTLEDISAVEYLQRVKAWAPVAQKLAHGIKNPLGTIMGAVEQIEIAVDRGRPKAEGRSQKTEGRSAEGGGGEEVKIQRPEAKSQDEEQRADEKVKKYVGYVKDEVTRLKKMTDAFMRFTKLNPPALEPRNMNELVRKVVAKYEGAMAKGISLELNLDDNLPPVALDEEGMANVLDIVIENAIEAMSTGRGSTTKAPRHQGSLVRASDSELTTKTQRHEAPERASTDCTDSRDGSARTPGPVNPGTPQRVLRIRTAVWSPATKTPRHEGSDTTPTDYADYTDSQTRTPGPLDPRAHVSIEVEDTGPGVPEKYLDKVFEPYFTHGKVDGTGLGLALAKKIVEDHKGRMEITSKEGEGTTVSIVLPTAGNGE